MRGTGHRSTERCAMEEVRDFEQFGAALAPARVASSCFAPHPGECRWAIGGRGTAAATILNRFVAAPARIGTTKAFAVFCETRFRFLADSAPVLIWMSGSDAGCPYFNQPWLAFTGRSHSQEEGKGWLDAVHADDRQHCGRLSFVYRSAFAARKSFVLEYRLRRHDGQYRWVLDHGVPRSTPEEGFLGYVGSCIDITERKNSQADVHRLQMALAHSGRVSTLGQFASALAHGLNQPLGQFCVTMKRQS
jgi:PAS domain S-box-containing protein